MTWPDAMGLVVLEGLVILVLVLTGFRSAVFHAVPAQLKIAISVGIGLFIALIGLVDAGFVRRIPDAANTTVPVQLGADGFARRLAGAGVRVRPAADDHAVRPQGPGRDPDLDPRHHGARDRRRGDRRRRPDVNGKNVNPNGWNLNVPALPDKIVDVPDFWLLGQFSLFGVVRAGRRRHRGRCSCSRCCSPTSSTPWAR